MWKKNDDWFWEGNVQQKIAIYLESKGYKVTTADTLSKSRGVDILAVKNLDELIIEVKGYPSHKYVDGEKQGQAKRTRPILQARHWFADALFSVIHRKGKYPSCRIAVGFPEFPRYRELIEEAKWAFEKLEIKVFIVTPVGEVYEL